MTNDGDISVVIPTIGRVVDLTRTLESIVCQTTVPGEVLVIDQSEEKSGQGVVKDFQGLLDIKYIYSTRKSSSNARNIGIRSSRGGIICVLDDDLFLDKDYFNNAIRFFRDHPDALGVQGINTTVEQGYLNKLGGKRSRLLLYNLFAAIFLLNRGGTTNKFLPSARNVYCKYTKDISNCQWLSGCCFYRRGVFSDLKCKFDENMIRYCYGEDKLFSYQLYKRFPKSLYIDPSIQYEHSPHLEGRLPNNDLIKTRILYNYYIWHEVVENTLANRVLFFWSSLGDLILHLAKGWRWFKIAIGVYYGIWAKSETEVLDKYKNFFNFQET